MSNWDEYRVQLFKRKIKECLPLMPGLRLYRSKGKTHLVVDVKWQYYSNADAVGSYVMTQLKQNHIEAKANMDIFGICEALGKSPTLDSISIPIDQAALPERSRS